MADNNCLPNFNDLCSKSDLQIVVQKLNQIENKLNQPDSPISITPCNLDSIKSILTDLNGRILENRIILQRIEGLLNQLANNNQVDLSPVINLINQVISLVSLPKDNAINFIKCLETANEDGEKYEIEYSLQNNSIGEFMIDFALQNQRIHEQLCEMDNNGDCNVLTDDRSVWTAHGYYLEMIWQWENATITSNANSWKIRNPISEIINPSDPSTVWDQYFAGIYYIVGDAYVRYWTENSLGENYRTPLIQGNFKNMDEAVRFCDSIKHLTTEIPLSENNPKGVISHNKQSSIVYVGEKKILKEVCVISKAKNSNQTIPIYTYAKT